MKYNTYLLLFLVIGQSSFSNKAFTSPQDTLQGKVVGIADGDTFTLLLDNKTTVKIRIASIDCPECKQPYSAVATKFISDAIFSRQVSVVVDSKERYGRSIGWVYYDGKNLNEELLKAGLAWHFRWYSKDEKLQAMEDQARVEKVGLWKDKNPIPPWDWRSHGQLVYSSITNTVDPEKLKILRGNTRINPSLRSIWMEYNLNKFSILKEQLGWRNCRKNRANQDDCKPTQGCCRDDQFC